MCTNNFYYREIWVDAETDVNGSWTNEIELIDPSKYVDMRFTGKWTDTIADGTGLTLFLPLIQKL